MNRNSDLESKRQAMEADIQHVLKSLRGPALKQVQTYIELLSELECARCAVSEDITHVRWSQGAAKALDGVAQLLSGDVQQRRAVSRRQV